MAQDVAATIENSERVAPHPEDAPRSFWFISVAFTASMLCGPIVIATGFLTARQPAPLELSNISVAALRQSFDMDDAHCVLSPDALTKAKRFQK